MDSLQQIFLQEASELLSELEEALLTFETDLTDKDSIERIFRVMHTLKGSSSMFGFQTVNDFTHELEYIYDALREGNLVATQEILELTLESVDHLKILINNKDTSDEKIAQSQASLLEKIKGCNSDPAITAVGDHMVTTNNESAIYYISFKPAEDIMKNGSNPMYLLEDLLELGSGLVLPAVRQLPDLKSLESFKLLLYSTVDNLRLLTDNPT